MLIKTLLLKYAGERGRRREKENERGREGERMGEEVRGGGRVGGRRGRVGGRKIEGGGHTYLHASKDVGE